MLARNSRSRKAHLAALALASALTCPMMGCATTVNTDLEVDDPKPVAAKPLPSTLTAPQRALAAATNQARQKNARAPFEVDAALSLLAQRHAEDMVKRGYFSHVNPEGQDPFKRLEIAGVRFRAAAENIAQNADPTAAVAGWLRSYAHRKNMLDKRYGKLGVGVASGPGANQTYVQVFTD
jgi:uncharacterized protein YkwD